jgi:hypothetical protein
VRLVALLNWYEESSQWLASLVASLQKANVEHIVAVDGAYQLFPDALTRPRSGSEQAAAITECAHSLNMGTTIYRPQKAWRGNEVEKRNHLVQLALAETEATDWLFQIDADELVDAAPYDLARRLEESEEDVAGVYFFQRNTKQPDPSTAVSVPPFNPLTLTEGFYGHRILFRALRDLRIEQAHYLYTAGPPDRPRYLRGFDDWHDTEPCLEINDFRVEHRHNFRMPSRQLAAEQYYWMRAMHSIERIKPTEGQPMGNAAQA